MITRAEARSQAADILHRLADRVNPRPLIMGDLQIWHVGCHIILYDEMIEIEAIGHEATHTVIYAVGRGGIRCHYRMPVDFTEPPLAVVRQIGGEA